MKNKWAPAFLKYIIFIIAFVSAILLAVWLVIPNMAELMRFFTHNEKLYNILLQLKHASIIPPFWLPIIFAFLIALLWHGHKKFYKARLWLLLIIPLSIIFTIAAFGLSLWYTKVNAVPFGLEIRIILSLWEGGALDLL